MVGTLGLLSGFRLVMVWEQKPEAGFDHGLAPAGDFIDWRQQSQSFERLVACYSRLFDLTGGDQPERLSRTQSVLHRPIPRLDRQSGVAAKHGAAAR